MLIKWIIEELPLLKRLSADLKLINQPELEDSSLGTEDISPNHLKTEAISAIIKEKNSLEVPLEKNTIALGHIFWIRENFKNVIQQDDSISYIIFYFFGL